MVGVCLGMSPRGQTDDQVEVGSPQTSRTFS